MSSAPVERCKLFHIRTCFTLGLVTIVRMSSAWAPRLPSEKDILTNPGTSVDATVRVNHQPTRSKKPRHGREKRAQNRVGW